MSTRNFSAVQPRAVALPVPRVGVGDDGFRFAITIGILMSIIIAGTVYVGKTVAFVSLPLLAIAIIRYSSSNPVRALCLFVMYLSLEGMYKYLSYYSQIVYVIRPLLSLIMVFGLYASAQRSGRPLLWPPLTPLTIFFMLWCLLAAFQPLGAGIVAGIGTALLWYIGPMLALLISYNIIKSTRQVETLVWSIVVVGVVVSLFTMLQYGMGQTWTESHLPGYSSMNEGIWWIKNGSGQITSVSFRPASTTAIGGGGGAWSNWGVIAAMGLLLSNKVSKRPMVFLYACLLILITGVICSAARVFLISTLVSVAFMLVVTAKSPRDIIRNLGLLVMIGAVTGGAVAAGNLVTGGVVMNRYLDTLADPVGKYDHDRGGVGYRAGTVVNTLINYPLGVGYQRGTESGPEARADRNKPHSVQENRDDQFGSSAWDLGLPGLAVFIWVISSVFARCWRIYSSLKDPNLRLCGAIFFTLFATFVVMAFSGPVFQGQDTVWLVAGAAFALPTVQLRERLLAEGATSA